MPEATGIIFGYERQEIATFEITESGNYKWIEVTYAGIIVIKFPLSIDADINEIGLRLKNILYNTAYKSSTIEIEFDPAE